MINYSNKFKDVLSIVETLSEKEKKLYLQWRI